MENNKIWKYSLAFLVFVLCITIYVNFLRPPGPDWSNHACVPGPDHDSVQYTYLDWSGDYCLGSQVEKVSVGGRLANFEKLDSLTPMPDGRWKARFFNTKTHLSKNHILRACPDTK